MAVLNLEAISIGRLLSGRLLIGPSGLTVHIGRIQSQATHCILSGIVMKMTYGSRTALMISESGPTWDINTTFWRGNRMRSTTMSSTIRGLQNTLTPIKVLANRSSRRNLVFLETATWMQIPIQITSLMWSMIGKCHQQFGVITTDKCQTRI
jgi:hypothetical protein